MPVARRSSNPVTAPIQRWMFHSPGRFAAVIGGTVVVMGIGGAVINPFTPSPSLAAGETASEGAAKTVTMQAGAEVTASEVLTISPEEAAKSPQVTAMKFVIAYIDLSPNSGEWIRGLTPYADQSAISAGFIAARPNYPVTISGSTYSTKPGPVVTITTSAGKIQASMGQMAGGGWKVLGPLPTLDAAAPPPRVADVAVPRTSPSSTSASAPPSTVTVTVSTSPSAPPASPPPTSPARPAAPAPVTTTVPPPRVQPPAPAPRPGTIPIPSGLDGPLPGG